MAKPAQGDPQELLRLGMSFWPCRIFLTAVDLGLFPILAGRRATAGEVARRLHADARGTTTLLDALAALGLLRKQGATYGAPRALAPFLDPEDERSILPMARHSVWMWERWSHLTEIVRTGRPAAWPGGPGAAGRSAEQHRAFIAAMHAVGRTMADRVVARIDARGARRLLDIGGASGTYTIAFLRAWPRLTATLFDLPETIPLARERLGRAGLLDRVTLRAGDFDTGALPGGHDLALLSAIIHQNSRGANVALFRKVRAALVPGGRLIIRDHVMDPTHTRPVPGALFAVNMLVATEGGGCYSLAEIREDLRRAGFGAVRLLHAGEMMDGLVQATRP